MGLGPSRTHAATDTALPMLVPCSRRWSCPRCQTGCPAGVSRSRASSFCTCSSSSAGGWSRHGRCCASLVGDRLHGQSTHIHGHVHGVHGQCRASLVSGPAVTQQMLSPPPASHSLLATKRAPWCQGALSCPPTLDLYIIPTVHTSPSQSFASRLQQRAAAE